MADANAAVLKVTIPTIAGSLIKTEIISSGVLKLNTVTICIDLTAFKSKQNNEYILRKCV